MSRNSLFLDSSALFAGIVSADGAARALLLLAETGRLRLLISEQVIAETERAIARKAPGALAEIRQAILRSRAGVLSDPDPQDVAEHLNWMADPTDIPILLAAMDARVDYLVTLNRRHFLDDSQVAQRSGLRIGTPGDALAWVRGQLSQTNETI
jgi:predicted nucleic acid-binding protein